MKEAKPQLGSVPWIDKNFSRRKRIIRYNEVLLYGQTEASYHYLKKRKLKETLWFDRNVQKGNDNLKNQTTALFKKTFESPARSLLFCGPVEFVAWD